ncbi:MAG: 6-phosphogluconolactonase, partial [Proteobacteria bacterium]|nr:6-phosphogluconolactonase [Pseudomonadota bacterium]
MELRMFDDLEHLSRAAAEVVVREAGRAVEARGRFLLVLSGGGTPARLYGILGESPLREAVPWDRVHVFWGDERCVPADHPDSNYALAQKTLLDRVPCPEAHVHRMAGELGARAAADRYEMELRDFFAPGGPEFDLVLLGMGPDGHTASLFPGQEVLDEKVRLTAPVQPPPSIRPAVPRLTLT